MIQHGNFRGYPDGVRIRHVDGAGTETDRFSLVGNAGQKRDGGGDDFRLIC